MNIVNKLTLRHLKENKRRTLVTIIGVIISVAMVTSVATLGVSFMDLMKRHTIANDGEWHVAYKSVNKAQLEAVEADESAKTVIISRDRGYAALKESQNENKPYLFIRDYNMEGFMHFPVKLNKGRLPNASDEIVISEAILTNAKVDYKIGDTLTLEIGERVGKNEEGDRQVLSQFDRLRTEEYGEETLQPHTTMNYTIVGIIDRPSWEPTWAPGYTALGYVDESIIGKNGSNTVNASVILTKVTNQLYAHAEELAGEIGLSKDFIEYNHGLLRYDGITNNDGLRSTLYSLSAIIMVIIMIGSVSLIYNAFAISVSERARHLGMLSSVGATKKQKRNSVFFEGAVIGLISIPAGFVAGLVGIAITFRFINSMIQGALGISEELTVIVTPFSIILACSVSMLTIFISTYLPARKASKISAIDAIRQTSDVKLTGKTVKTSKLVRKIFGIEAEIGLKNLKRNKRRYQATIFSLVISIVLFLTVSFFTTNLKKSLELSQEGLNYDIEVALSSEKPEENEQFVRSIGSLQDVTEYSVNKRIGANTWIEESMLGKELQELVKRDPSVLQNGKYPYYVQIIALDRESLTTYADAIGANVTELKDTKQLKAIVIDTTKYEDMTAGKYVETKTIHTRVGHRLDVYDTEGEANGDTGEKMGAQQVEVAALTKILPTGVHPPGVGELILIVSESVLDRLADRERIRADLGMYLFLKSSDPMATQQQIEEMKQSGIYVFNVYKSRQQDQQMLMLMSVFIYGFIILITAISIANIFNTISTSISLRKREFAMLKSVGMTPKGFNKMINYESIFYGIKALLYGLPLSVVVMYLIHKSLMNSFNYGFTLPWSSIVYVIVSVFVMISAAMLYSSSKVKRENIIDALKQENI
ncbi:ABC transporter permease [Paenibacillus fonticola]|uniref:ABC transporter permease n=1 Tax=Paenibacillus fonticola TaxID=379896 RepID=UPI000476CD3D|nr:FtsX-like permease family protein [Paenibacillus fonticola]